MRDGPGQRGVPGGSLPVSSLRVKADLVRYLRAGVRREMAEAAGVLQVELEGAGDQSVYESALARFDLTRDLLDLIGSLDRPLERDLTVDLTRYRGLLVEVLRAQYVLERMRLQDAAASGLPILSQDLLALKELLGELQAQPEPPAPHHRDLLSGRPERRPGCRH